MTHIAIRNSAGGVTSTMVISDSHLGKTNHPSLQTLATIIFNCCLHYLYVARTFVRWTVNNLPLIFEVAKSSPVNILK